MAQPKKTHMQVYESDLERLRKIAKKEKRTMLVMFELLIDHWEDKK